MSRRDCADLTFGDDGTLSFVYEDAEKVMGDDVRELFEVGDLETTRASHVEPHGEWWMADMGLMGGPVLGPFMLRASALQAEREWLREERGL